MERDTLGHATEGPMPCLGERCRYDYCDGKYAGVVLFGEPCPLEAEYARMHEEAFRDDYERLSRAHCIEDFDDLVRQNSACELKRLRATIRGNRAWDLTDADGQLTPAAFREMDLAYRYSTTALRKGAKIRRLLSQAHDELVAHREYMNRVIRGLEPLPDGTYLYEHQLC